MRLLRAAGTVLNMLTGHQTLQAYDLPALDVDLRLAKGNLAPHTIMRGPGYIQAVMVIEQVGGAARTAACQQSLGIAPHQCTCLMDY